MQVGAQCCAQAFVNGTLACSTCNTTLPVNEAPQLMAAH
jgi:hypothetical protein